MIIIHILVYLHKAHIQYRDVLFELSLQMWIPEELFGKK